jgi:hypothetical protein
MQRPRYISVPESLHRVISAGWFPVRLTAIELFSEANYEHVEWKTDKNPDCR